MIIHIPSTIFLVFATVTPSACNFFVRNPPAIMPGMVDNHGTTLKTVKYKNAFKECINAGKRAYNILFSKNSPYKILDLPFESSSGKLSWKYVGNQLNKIKKQLF